MHGLLITFTATAPPETLQPQLDAYADALVGRDGLVLKAWLRDGDTLGGFYIWRDADAAEAYLASELLAGLKAIVSDFQVRRFELLDDLGARTGIPVPTR